MSLYLQYEHELAQAQLVLFMLAMGVTLTIEDFRRTFRLPKSLLMALSGQIILSPLIAVAINHLFGLTGGLALGLILISAMPGGSLAKAFVLLGRGNAPLAISLTGVSTLCSIVTVPLIIKIFAQEYVPPGFTMPVTKIVRDVVVFMLVPLVVGMYLGSAFPDRRKTMRARFGRLGLIVVILMVVGAMRNNRVSFGAHGLHVSIAIIIFILVCMQANMLPFRLTRAPREDTLTAGIEMSMRNANLALLLKSSLLPEVIRNQEAEVVPVVGDVALLAWELESLAMRQLSSEVMFVLLFYAGAALVIGLPLSLNFLRMARRDDLTKKAASLADADKPLEHISAPSPSPEQGIEAP